MPINVQALQDRIANASGVSKEGEALLKDMVRSLVDGMPIPEKFDEVVAFVSDGEKCANLMQALFIESLFARDPKKAEEALEYMPQILRMLLKNLFSPRDVVLRSMEYEERLRREQEAIDDASRDTDA